MKGGLNIWGKKEKTQTLFQTVLTPGENETINTLKDDNISENVTGQRNWAAVK